MGIRMKNLVIGILASVDAGKTTLAENILYECGTIRKVGRVDNQDAFLDTNEMERKRGITIFSKQAVMKWGDEESVTLLDTPGHVDFSTEMERSLQVLDYAILVISASDLITGHTRTLWKLLEKYSIPVFIFINKMDLSDLEHSSIMGILKSECSDACIEFGKNKGKEFQELIAMSDELILEHYLKTGMVSDTEIADRIQKRAVFPCIFGAALRQIGMSDFIRELQNYVIFPVYSEKTKARVYKITRDEQGNRMTHLKLTGGKLAVKDLLNGEKVNQIRVYSGASFETYSEAFAGQICAVCGPSATYTGQGLGGEEEEIVPEIEPVLNYQLILPEEINAVQFYPKLLALAEEDPSLHIQLIENSIQIELMGTVQKEVIRQIILDRFQTQIQFGPGRIVYKETIQNIVEGIGHYEPLRHYAEVHLLLEPGEPGSGIQIASECKEEILAHNWQNQVLTRLLSREYCGILTGSVITDLKITLLSGRANIKHTEGQDFTEATDRAVRQGLMQAECILLEPYYQFRLCVPEKSVGRAMTDLDQLQAQFDSPKLLNGNAVLSGICAVAQMAEYQVTVLSYTGGKGTLFLEPVGYYPCMNQEEIIKQTGYMPEHDLLFPSASVFCMHGAGTLVPWYQVPQYMHLDRAYKETPKGNEIVNENSVAREMKKNSFERQEISMGIEEIDRIIKNAQGGNQKEKKTFITRRVLPSNSTEPKLRKQEKREPYLLVDGYNVIFAWAELADLARINIDSARGRLQDILCNYQGMKKCNVVLVFDAYRIVNHNTEYFDYHNIHIVFTKERETADQYIEHFSHEHALKYDITVVTSDGLEQIIIIGQGCHLISSREFLVEVQSLEEQLRKDFL